MEAWTRTHDPVLERWDDDADDATAGGETEHAQ